VTPTPRPVPHGPVEVPRDLPDWIRCRDPLCRVCAWVTDPDAVKAFLDAHGVQAEVQADG